MKILQVVPYYYLSWSKDKPVEIISEISSTLCRKGHEVTIFTTDIFNKKGNIPEKSDEGGIKIHEFSSMGKYPFFISLDMLKTIAGTLKNFDIIHVHEYRIFSSIIVYYFAKKHGVPYIIEAHGALPRSIGHGFYKKGFDLLIGNRILRNASSVIAITQKEAIEYEQLGVPKERIRIIPNGVDLSIMDTLPQKGNFRREYSLADNSILILYVGRLDESKGIDLLIQAFGDISKTVDNTILIIIGKDYGFETTLKSLVKKLDLETKVIFTDFLERNKKMSAFIDAAVFVTPSFSGFPHTFLEACACGVPIVTTDRFDNLDWINNNVGYSVKYDKKELISAIEKILTNEQLSGSFKTAAKNIIINKFNWDIICDDLIKTYYHTIERSRMN